MIMRKVIALSGVLAILAGSAAFAAGYFPGFPQPGDALFNGGALTGPQGTELMAADVQANFASGTMPQTELLTPNSLAVFGGRNVPRNALAGFGDYTVNPFQRGTSQAADIANTLTYGPDQMWILGGGAGALVDWSKQTGATDIIAGFGASLRVQRKATNADVTAICKGWVLPSIESTRFQGQSFAYSFWALAGANFSAASKNITVTIASGTGANQSAANFSTAAWTTQTSATLVAGTNAVFTATNGQFPISTTWTRYTVTGVIPAAATQVGGKVCFTPVGTAGTNDWIEFIGEQFEPIPTGTKVASPFEFVPADFAIERALRYLYVITDAAATVRFVGGLAISTTVGQYAVQFPQPMRAAPTTTATLAASFANSSSAGAAVNCTTMAAIASSNTTTSGGVSCTGAASLTAGNATNLIGQATAGQLQFSAEL